ncbi:hypothetical protein ACVWZL_001730 [Bradyrhizobium sp. GM2.4]
MPERISILLQPEMAVHRLHQEHHCGHPDHRQSDQRAERDVPVPLVGEEKTGRDAQHLACSEGGLHETHDAAAQLQREQIGDDGEHDRADHAAEQAGHDPPQQQQMIVGRDRAQHRAKGEAGVEEQQQPLAIKPVGKAGRQDAGNPRAERIGRDRHAELSGRNIERRHHDGAERRHDHEIDDDRELDQRQQRNEDRLVAREASGWRLPLGDRLRQGLFGHGIHLGGSGGGRATWRRSPAIFISGSAKFRWLDKQF